MPCTRFAFAVPVLLILAACQAVPPEQAALRASQSCARGLERSSNYIGLAPFIPLAGERATEEQLANRAIPGLPERVMLREWKAGLARCRLSTLAAASVLAPDAVETLRLNYFKSDQVIDELIAGRTTWAIANQKRDAIGAASERRLWASTAVAAPLPPSTTVRVIRRTTTEQPVSLSPSRPGTSL